MLDGGGKTSYTGIMTKRHPTRAEKREIRRLCNAALRNLPAGASPVREMKLDLYPRVTKKTKGSLHPGIKALIFAVDPICAWCRVERSTTIDHVLPLARGGQNVVSNLVGSCEPCNKAKADFLPSELGWVLKLPLRAFNLEQGVAARKFGW